MEPGKIVTGRLIGVGVGPGDPELVTRKAWRLIQEADVIAYPQPDTGESFARAIVAEAIGGETEEIAMTVPMRGERFPAQEVYDRAAARIGARLDQGCDVIVLCEGDPFFYGSFMYLFARLVGDYPCEIVPGVSSLTAVAAALKRPICGRNDVVAVLPATLPEGELRVRIEASEAIVIIKLGRHLPKMRALLDGMGLANRTGYVSHASLPQQCAVPLADAPETAPYFSMLLIYKGADPWLS